MTVIETLFQVLDTLIKEDGPWKAKRDKILAEAGPDDKTNLAEFIAWFEEEENV
jgi:hypothetical protein